MPGQSALAADNPSYRGFLLYRTARTLVRKNETTGAWDRGFYYRLLFVHYPLYLIFNTRLNKHIPDTRPPLGLPRKLSSPDKLN